MGERAVGRQTSRAFHVEDADVELEEELLDLRGRVAAARGEQSAKQMDQHLQLAVEPVTRIGVESASESDSERSCGSGGRRVARAECASSSAKSESRESES